MTPDDIMKIIDMIPRLIIYFLPGFLFYRIIKYQLSYKHVEKKSEYICYVVVSAIFIKISEYFSLKIKGQVDIYSPEFDIGLTMLSVILGYSVGRFLNSSISTDVLSWLKIYRTNGASIFADIKDIEYGTWICVYLNNTPLVYNGALREIEYASSYDETFVLLSNYITYKCNKESDFCEELYKDEREDTNWVAIRVRDISRIEISYDPNSKKIK